MVGRNERVKRISGVATAEDCFSPVGSEDEKDKKDFRMPLPLVPYAAVSGIRPWSKQLRRMKKIKRIFRLCKNLHGFLHKM